MGGHCGGLRLWDGRSPSLSALTRQVGITLHYSSLSTLLWMGVKARVLHKELTWRAPPPQEGDAAVPAPRRSLQRGLHKALPGILLLLVVGVRLGAQGMLNSADGWIMLGSFAAVVIAKSVYDFYWLYNHNDKH